ncbi:MAG: AlpA family phage regulatory protein [Burkholderiales bacterium]|nr:AlpA family phage regulatory protein [Burkholderiales bacterium]
MLAEVLLSRKDVEALTSLSTSVIYREMAAGRLARPIRVSPGRVAWLASDIDAFIASRVAERDAEVRQRAAERARSQARRSLLAAVA